MDDGHDFRSPFFTTPTRIVLLDIPTALGVPTSPNTWKVRLVLNYKGLAHRTHWVPTSHIQRVCPSLSIPPTGTNPDGTPHYTLPALIDSTRADAAPVHIADSTPIIDYLECAYPNPDPARAIRQPGQDTVRAEALLAEAAAALFPLLVLQILAVKPPADAADFRARTERAHGRPLEALALRGAEREAAWARVARAFGGLARVAAASGGAWLSGGAPGVADFALGGMLVFVRRTGGEEVWARVAAWDGGRWAEFWRACEAWIVVRA